MPGYWEVVAMLSRARKVELVAGIKKDIEAAKAVFLTNVIGISANETAEVRKKIRAVQGKVVVTRNTLFKRAAEGTYTEELLSALKGANALAIAFEDAPAVAKVLKQAGEDFEVMEIKGGYLEGDALTVAQVKELADLPSREQMLGTLLATFMAPAATLARLLNALKEECEKQGVERPADLKLETKATDEA